MKTTINLAQPGALTIESVRALLAAHDDSTNVRAEARKYDDASAKWEEWDDLLAEATDIGDQHQAGAFMNEHCETLGLGPDCGPGPGLVGDQCHQSFPVADPRALHDPPRSSRDTGAEAIRRSLALRNKLPFSGNSFPRQQAQGIPMPNGQPERRLRCITPAEDYSHQEPLDAALDLIRRLKVYADRSASPIAHELCVEATEFVAKYTRTKP